ncbi:MAG: FUSC family protein [Candidatus Sulfotelmatobacter sp.]
MASTYKLTLDTLLDAVRTTVAAVVAMLLARTLKLPEYYWAPISAIVIIESTIDPRTVSWQRFAGTALGAALGALVATFFPPKALVYAVRNFLVRSALCASPAARRLPLYSHYSEYRCSSRAPTSSVDRSLASLCGGVAGNRCGARPGRSVATSRVIV